MHTFVGVGGPRLDLAGGGWDGWPIVGGILALWIGRRVLQVSWGPALLIAALVASLVLPVTVHAWGIVPTAGLVLIITIVLRIARSAGSAKRNRAV